MPAIVLKARRAAERVGAAVLRIVIVFVLLLHASDALMRLAIQVAPASFWFEIDRMEILPSGTVTIVYRRSHVGDLPVSSIVELLGPGGAQPCASSGRRVIEADSTYAIVPIDRILPDCRWSDLPDGHYRLALTVSYPAGGLFDKSVSVQSVNAIRIREGAIVGATSPTTP